MGPGCSLGHIKDFRINSWLMALGSQFPGTLVGGGMTLKYGREEEFSYCPWPLGMPWVEEPQPCGRECWDVWAAPGSQADCSRLNSVFLIVSWPTIKVLFKVAQDGALPRFCSVDYWPVFMTIPYCLNITIVYNVLKSGSFGPLALTFSKLLWIF